MSTPVVPGLEGIPIAESQISFVDGDHGVLEYRGINIAELSKHSTFEEVTYLLLNGHIPNVGELTELKQVVRENHRLQERVLDIIRTLPPEGHPMDALQAAVAATGMCFDSGDLTDDRANYLASLRLIAKLPTMVAAFARVRNGEEPIQPDSDLDHAANFLYMLTGERPTEDAAKILDICLILHADHTMNASTFAARVVGSTLATPFAVVSSAIGALSGPLHGGANERVLKMLQAIPDDSAVEPTIAAKIEAREKIMGFGHRVYKTNDPRATVLRGLANQLLEDSRSKTLSIARLVEDAVTSRLGTKGIYANVDFYSGLVYNAIGIPTDLFTPVFAIARVSGWLAHWLEQLVDNRIYRPRQVYTGQHDLRFERPV
jgi:citrate synthase